VRELRLARNYTQEELAERAGLSYKFIGEVERGIGNPSLSTLERLSGALDIDIAELFGGRATAYAEPSAGSDFVRETVESLQQVIARLEGAPSRRRARRPKERKTRKSDR
jgi:transcriptional regulator with XRE-family HTH domain